MNLLIQSAKIICKGSSLNGKIRDILITDGVIEKISEKINAGSRKKVKVFDAAKNCVSIGWFDMKADFCDPGYEHKEDLHSGIKAAVAGGFTGVLLMPSTKPTLQSKADIEYVVNKSKGQLADVYAAGALSVNREGKDMTEMYDMKLAGAVAFTDDRKPVADTGLMQRCLQYAKDIDTLLISYADDAHLTGKSQVNESYHSMLNGFKGTPALAEEIMVARDIQLAEYTGSPLHFSTVTTAGSVELIRKAKKKGIRVTCEVSAYHLLLDDSYLSSFNSNYKVKPPLRTKSDIKALLKGVADGTIDVICSDHQPQDVESKNVEFEFAAFGIISSQTAFACANTALKDSLPVDELIEKISLRPRQVLNLPVPEIKEGAKANLTIFNPIQEWTFEEENILSKSKNSPFIGKKMIGKVIGTINNNRVEFFQ